MNSYLMRHCLLTNHFQSNDSHEARHVCLIVQARTCVGADLRDADLSYANLYDANLTDADLTDANLRDAHLRDADLRGANLRNAELRYARLIDANLRGANLRGADLRAADLIGALDLNQTIYPDRAIWFETTCPDGSMNPDSQPCSEIF